jgi:endonuclease-8
MQDQAILSARGRHPALPAWSLVGRRVTDVQARGKHLLMRLDDERVLHSHMGMTGSWHVYASGEPWKKPEGRAALALELVFRVCVCFSPKLLELLTASEFRGHRYLKLLGPDLLARKLDEAEILRRFRLHAPTPIGVALMNQSILCGIGNVYKSEVLFLSGICPRDPVRSLDDGRLLELIRTARKWMRCNLDGYPRRTRRGLDGKRHWVYGRAGQPCFRCGLAIRLRRQGDAGRTTYWCPHCQPPLAETPSAASS